MSKPRPTHDPRKSSIRPTQQPSMRKWPNFNIYDFFLAFVFVIQYFYLITNWDSITCIEPINWWWAVDWGLVAGSRVFFVLRSTDYPKKFKFFVQLTLYIFFLPIMSYWLACGFIWKSESYDDDPHCIPDSMVPQSYTVWLIITAYIVLYLLVKLGIDIHEKIKVDREIKRS